MSFVELHSSSYFSFLSASSSPEDLAMVAKDQGLPAIALSDYSGLYGVIPFYNKCKELGIKAIIASVLILENGDKISLICKNQKAYEDLCLLITLSRKGQEKGISTTSYQILSEHSENFIVLLAFKSSLLYDLIISNSSKEANQLLDQYLEIFDKKINVDESPEKPENQPESPEKEDIISIVGEQDDLDSLFSGSDSDSDSGSDSEDDEMGNKDQILNLVENLSDKSRANNYKEVNGYLLKPLDETRLKCIIENQTPS